MKKVFDNPWIYRIIALIFAILLFIYINQSQLTNPTSTDTKQTTQMATKTQSVKATLQVSADTEKYFVTGYPENVSVGLEGPSALVASTVNTMNFRAFIDLRDLKTGKHKVEIEVSGLNNQITYSVKPKAVTVNIQPRRSKTFPIQVVYNKDSIPAGYEISTPKTDPSVVSVTGPKSEVELVDHIEARVSIPKDSTSTIEEEVILQAVDKDGRQLNTVLTPATTHVTIPITLPSKEVKVKLTQKNGSEDHVYALTSKTTHVNIYGAEKKLEDISEIELEVDLKDKKTSFSDTYTLEKPSGVIKVDPTKIRVNVNIKANE